MGRVMLGISVSAACILHLFSRIMVIWCTGTALSNDQQTVAPHYHTEMYKVRWYRCIPSRLLNTGMWGCRFRLAQHAVPDFLP